MLNNYIEEVCRCENCGHDTFRVVDDNTAAGRYIDIVCVKCEHRERILEWPNDD